MATTMATIRAEELAVFKEAVYNRFLSKTSIIDTLQTRLQDPVYNSEASAQENIQADIQKLTAEKDALVAKYPGIETGLANFSLTADDETQVDNNLQSRVKVIRDQMVKDIVVTVGNKTFDGDETSQTRMARAIINMTDSETIDWTLADNTNVPTTKAELTDALRLAGEEQSRIWVEMR